MGLFNKKRTAPEKLKSIQEGTYTPQNIFQLEQEMYGKEAAINAQVGETDQGQDIYYNQWLQVNQWADYFCGVFKYEVKQFKHNLLINRALRAGFIYGSIGVWNNNGTPELCSINKNNQTPDTVEIIVITDDSKEFTSYQKTYQVVPRSAVIEYRFDTLGYSAFLTLAPVFKWERLAQKSLYNETLVLPTRILHDVDASNPLTSAAKQLVQFKSPVIHRQDGGTDRFSGLSLSVAADMLISTVEYTKNYWYEIVGRRTNADFKRAHSLEAEVDASTQNARAIETSRYLYLKKFLRDYADLFNVEILLENVNGRLTNVFDDMDLLEVENEVKGND